MPIIKRLPVPKQRPMTGKHKPPVRKPPAFGQGRLSPALSPPTIKDQIVLVTAAPNGPKSRIDHWSPLPSAVAVKRMHRP
ncbi:MAG TPA: hypothetical protein VIE66_09475 [Methylocella sp.]|jgi:hypothetical protein